MSIQAALPETDLCRLSIATPANVLELALPSTVPLADFLPAVLSFAGPELADAGLAHDGWVLQRLGGAPLAPARTLAELRINDGETLYLRPRRTAAPAAVFDDVVDGLATAVRERADRLRQAAGAAAEDRARPGNGGRGARDRHGRGARAGLAEGRLRVARRPVGGCGAGYL
ncbi:EsaB/YukD family protein [Catenulispora pinisilvae]|uniref:EsaB/YukD family protein n=1 Tax=Catenulispora pinisilvae TaxID=2705253 RepID=UPI001890C23F|nr:EsaB/YukD family protein [Catenulispora pinisilvae]